LPTLTNAVEDFAGHTTEGRFLRIRSFAVSVAVALACASCVVAPLRAQDGMLTVYVQPPDAAPLSLSDFAADESEWTAGDEWLLPSDDYLDQSFDNILLLQEVAPLAPGERLRPAAPGTTPEGARSARSMLGTPPLANLSAGQQRSRMLARARTSAPAMIGDFFGGVPASPAQFPGLPFDHAVTATNRLILAGFTLQNNLIAPSGQFYGPPAGGGLANAPGTVFGPQGNILALAGLVRTNDKGIPLTGNQPRLAATATGQTIAGIQQVPGSNPELDPGSPIFAVRPLTQVVFPFAGSSGAGLLGRAKIAENTSPMPRDRYFFNSSYFSGVPLSAGGVNVNRFTPGFEETFFNGLTSIEMRFPFATTLGNNVLVDGTTNTGNVLFGDISVAGKALLYVNGPLAVSGGLQVAVPTARGLNAQLSDGTQLVRITNNTVYVMPFLGALYTPDDRFFAQGFLQFDAPANANHVSVNNFTGGLVPAGTSRDVTFVYVDVGGGYWLYRNDDAPRLTGFSATAELHYNQSLQTTSVIDTGLYQIGTAATSIEMLNAVVGGHLHFNLNSTLSIAYVAPIGNSGDRMFNGELRAFFNCRFGPQTLRTRTTL
jgi:hypothetical protein